MGRAGDGGYLSAAVRAEWRLVATDEGTENGCDWWDGVRCSATRLDSGWRTRACRGAWDGERDGALGETNRGSGKVAGGGEARANERMTGRGRGAAERKPAASACERRRFRPFHATGGREMPSVARFLLPLRKFPRVNGH